jgi:hypothetical protein
MRRNVGASLAVASLFGLALSGCGSTAKITASTTQGLSGGSADGGLGPAAGAADPAGAAAPVGGTAGGRGQPVATDAHPAGAVGTNSVGGSTSAAQGGGPPQSTNSTSIGVTATTISVGVAIADDAKAANTALGAGAVTHGDETAEYRAKVADLNAHGGAAGRKVLLVEYHYDVTNGASTAEIEQQGCSYFTEDHKVAVVLNVPLTENGIACLTHKGVAVFGGSLSYSTDRTFSRFPRYSEPIAMNLSRVVTNYAEGLENLKYFSPTAKVGFLTYDYAPFARATSQLRAALAKHGRRLDDVATVKYPEKQSDLSAEGADVSSAILRFRSDGITHVMFLDPSGVSQLLFLNQAESQGYRPRYGFGQSGAAALRSTGVPAAQFIGSVTVGWFPRLDGVPPSEGLYPPAEKACLAMFARNGISFDSDNARRHAADICDSFDVLNTVVGRASGQLNADTITSGVRALGPTPGAGTYRLRLAGVRPDGVDQVRYNAYAANCDCWHYVGGVRPAI